jgi:hypothetical protein
LGEPLRAQFAGTQVSSAHTKSDWLQLTLARPKMRPAGGPATEGTEKTRSRRSLMIAVIWYQVYGRHLKLETGSSRIIGDGAGHIGG